MQISLRMGIMRKLIVTQRHINYEGPFTGPLLYLHSDEENRSRVARAQGCANEDSASMDGALRFIGFYVICKSHRK